MTTISDWSQWESHFATFLERQTGEPDAAHDMAHIQRVVASARALAVQEGALLEVVLPAAWLHDCVVVVKSSPQRALASRLAAHSAGDFLLSSGYPAEFIPEIQHAIEAHSFSAAIAPRTCEAKVVQDADRLDALGAIGIARCLMLGAQLNRPLYDPQEPFPESREPDDSRYTLDHFYRKLLRLADSMTTEAGRAEAQRRTAFIQEFLDQLRRELGLSVKRHAPA